MVIGDITLYKAGQHLASKHVNRYITDGEVAAANLVVNADVQLAADSG